MRLLSKHSFNVIFRVDADGDRFVLRIGDATRIHSAGVEDVEANWLTHLDEGGELVVPRPLRSADSSWRVDHRTNAVTGTRACSLFTFVEGRELRTTSVDAGAMHLAGATLATLHDNASSSLPPLEVSSDLRADRVVYFHDENLVKTYESDHGTLFRDAVERVQSTIDDLWAAPPHEPHLLHGDFGSHNLLVWRNQLRPIDFQDLQLGFDIQDVGISVADLDRNTPELTPSFLAGYRSRRTLPEISPALLAAFAAGRSLNMMNLGLHLRRQGVHWFLKHHSERIRAWMRTD